MAWSEREKKLAEILLKAAAGSTSDILETHGLIHIHFAFFIYSKGEKLELEGIMAATESGEEVSRVVKSLVGKEDEVDAKH